MNWKEFLQPTLPKIIIAIILFLVLPIVPLPVQTMEGDPGLPYILENGFDSSRQIIAGSLAIIGNEPSSILTVSVPDLILFSVISLIISYLISCLILHLYKTKVKK